MHSRDGFCTANIKSWREEEGERPQAAGSHTGLSINFAFPLPGKGDSFPNMGLAAFWVISSVCDNVPWIPVGCPGEVVNRKHIVRDTSRILCLLGLIFACLPAGVGMRYSGHKRALLTRSISAGDYRTECRACTSCLWTQATGPLFVLRQAQSRNQISSVFLPCAQQGHLQVPTKKIKLLQDIS